MNRVDANESSSTLVIRTGTSFGECIGYCNKNYVVSNTSITLTKSGYDPRVEVPIKTCQIALSAMEWRSLQVAADFDAFRKQPENQYNSVYTDAGFEYIELELNGQKHRVTFEYGKTVAGFEPLVMALRNQRTTFNDCK